jgi:hypothetical protein
MKILSFTSTRNMTLLNFRTTNKQRDTDKKHVDLIAQWKSPRGCDLVIACVTFVLTCHNFLSRIKLDSHADTQRHGFYKTRIGIIISRYCCLDQNPAWAPLETFLGH